jgi:hypothetical protein
MLPFAPSECAGHGAAMAARRLIVSAENRKFAHDAG